MKIRWELFFIDYNFEEYWRTNGGPKDGKLTREGQDFIKARQEKLDVFGIDWSYYVATQEAEMTQLLGVPTAAHIDEAKKRTDSEFNVRVKDSNGNIVKEYIHWDWNKLDLALFNDSLKKEITSADYYAKYTSASSFAKNTRRSGKTSKEEYTLRFVKNLQKVFLDDKERVKKNQIKRFGEKREALRKKLDDEVIEDKREIIPGKILSLIHI